MAKYNTVNDMLTACANVIRNKTGKTAKIAGNDLPDAINEISSLNTSDATATANDVLKDKTFYANGEKLTGNVNTLSSVLVNDPSLSFIQGGVRGSVKSPSSGYINTNTSLNISLGANNLGNATAVDVVKDKTFTSANGLKVAGTLPYITGNEMKTGHLSNYIGEQSTTQFYIKYPHNTKKAYAVGSAVKCVFPKSDFGNATPADVAKGKTFLSQNSKSLQTGTYEATTTSIPAWTGRSKASISVGGTLALDANFGYVGLNPSNEVVFLIGGNTFTYQHDSVKSTSGADYFEITNGKLYCQSTGATKGTTFTVYILFY